MMYSIDDQTPQTTGRDFFIAPNAAVIGDVHIGVESSIWFGAVVRGDADQINIGRGTNIQDGSVLHTDPGAPLNIGEHVTVGHMVMLHGCRIGNYSLIGIGSTVLNHAVIGANSVVGAHSLITERKSFPDGVMILGSPAKVIRELTADEIALLKKSADVYIARAKLYRDKLTAC